MRYDRRESHLDKIMVRTDKNGVRRVPQLEIGVYLPSLLNMGFGLIITQGNT